MNIPCANKLNFCPCTENPLANLSSEEPDIERFIQIHYNSILGPAPIVLCEESDLVDLANCPHVCDPDIETCPCDSSTDCCDEEACKKGCTNKCCEKPKPASCVPPVIYYNHEVSCIGCDFTVTIPAGTFTSIVSQADADAKAQSVCEYRACYGPRGTQSPCIARPKPIIIGFTQPSPITAVLGSDLTLTVLYTFSGSDPLTFTWYKDFIPFQVTSGPSLTLNNVTFDDAGIYQLRIALPLCPGANSALVQVVVVECDTTGNPCPTGPDAFDIPLVDNPLDPLFGFPAEIDWETFTMSMANVIETPNDPGSGIPFFQWITQPDHPPGTYEVEWVSGFFEDTVISANCAIIDPLTPHFYNMQLQLEDEEKRQQFPGVSSWLCNDIRDVTSSLPPPPPPVNTYGTGAQTGCVANEAAGSAFFSAFFNTDPMKRWSSSPLAGHDHSNTGGKFAMSFVPPPPALGGSTVDVPGFPMTFKIVQVDGLIQQPRILQVDDWAIIGPQLGAGIFSDWDGALNTRTTYTDTQCQWDDPAFGLFGGATCNYTQAHPTAPNGCGWILQISDFTGLVWVGYKIVGDTGNGSYQVAATSPNQDIPCIVLIDATP